ncbi:MAG: proline--tRNA ligase, partial [Flavobacteriaceae bacterium]|nr:proline--tRNA ligase [Flavobacteriaceae bacterium]
YFPLFVPKSLFEAEEKNAEGFAKECAVVTHYRLQNDPDNLGKLRVDPKAKLEEELVVRPTSEAIIWNTFKGWVQSYRDLPLLINQWANVVRWEMRTRLFLRTAEFLWQEGHTAHATKAEAVTEAKLMNSIYANFAENFMAIPVIQGVKTESERFAGAEETYCIEALMQDGKALQAGTSHFLGQNFAKAFDVKFANSDGKQDYVWATSWGVSTRLMGALIMTHSDDKGLVLPPNLAPYQVVIVPIYRNDEQLAEITAQAETLMKSLRAENISVKYDHRTTQRPGAKFAQHELQGVPLRIAIGPKDLESGTVELARRDTLTKQVVALEGLTATVKALISEIQNGLFQNALDFRADHITKVETFDEFKAVLEEKTGFISAHWDGSIETEDKIKDLTKATIRCIPIDSEMEEGVCVFSGKPSKQRVLFAKAY